MYNFEGTGFSGWGFLEVFYGYLNIIIILFDLKVEL